MSKPRRSTRQEFYDIFSDFELEDQATVLEFLSEIHRLKRREIGKVIRATEPKSAKTDEQPMLDGVGPK